jgi:hypothetical protein
MYQELYVGDKRALMESVLLEGRVSCAPVLPCNLIHSNNIQR